MFQIQSGGSRKETYFLSCKTKLLFYWNYYIEKIQIYSVRSGEEEKEETKEYRVTI